MKVIDKNFNSVGEPSNVKEIVNNIESTLRNTNVDKDILEESLSNFNDLFIQISEDDTYSIKLPNGSLRQNRISSGVGALKTNMSISVNPNELYIEPGIVMRKNFNNHQLTHEMLHGITSKKHNSFDENGITYTKTGTKIDYYDKSLDDYENPNNLSSNGLNEGITELLTSIITGEYTGSYAPFVVISYLFMSSNNYLLNAYFMKDIAGMEKFYKDVEERQALITRDDFITLSSKCTDTERLSKIISAGLEYNKSYGKEISENELDFFMNYLDSNFMLDSGSWRDMISKPSITC